MSASVVRYVTSSGKVPYRDWLGRLNDTVAKASVIRRIRRIELRDFGDCKQIGEGVSELRIDVGPGYRFYFGTIGSSIIVLLCAGSKRTQSRDIERAKRYWRDHQKRYDQS